VKRWEQIVFGLSSLVILCVIGYKLHALDMPTARFVRSFNIHLVNRIGDVLAVAGQGVVIGSVFVVILLVGWYLKRDWLRQLGLRGLGAQLLVGLTVQVLKHLIGRPRPRFAHADEFTLGPSLDTGLDSFPSGHAINSFAAAAVVGRFVPKVGAPLFFIAALVGISRVMRGSHFPTDVYVGAVLGVLIGGLVAAGFRRWHQEFVPRLIRIGVPAVVLLFILVWIALHPAPAWSAELSHLAVGGFFILLGMFLRAVALSHSPIPSPGAPALLMQWVTRRNRVGGARLHSLGGSTLALGVATACGPWWSAGLMLAAVVPWCCTKHDLGSGSSSGRATEPLKGSWKREALAVSAAVLGIIALRSVQGILPLA
jgi:membrane-associated phospholipid phosphatase